MTGVLPVALGEATKIIKTFLPAGKEYICIMRLHAEVKRDKVTEIIGEFVGELYQRPPIRSAVKRRLRVREIYYIKDIEFKDKCVLFCVGCQAGTYIRKLCFDIGEALGSGANMQELRRTKAGSFREDKDLVSLYDLSDAYAFWKEEDDEAPLRNVILPMEKALTLLPKIYIRDSAVDSICHGADLAVPGIVQLESGILRNNLIGIFTLKGEIVALARALKSTIEILDLEHGIVTDTERVIMHPQTYPRVW